MMHLAYPMQPSSSSLIYWVSSRGYNDFNGNIGDCGLRPPLSPEDVLVRFAGQLIENRCVLFYCTVEFSRIQ